MLSSASNLTDSGVVILLSKDYIVGLVKGDSYPTAFWDISQNVPNKFTITTLNSASFYDDCK